MNMEMRRKRIFETLYQYGRNMPVILKVAVRKIGLTKLTVSLIYIGVRHSILLGNYYRFCISGGTKLICIFVI
jgi:hypothetical protein